MLNKSNPQEPLPMHKTMQSVKGPNMIECMLKVMLAAVIAVAWNAVLVQLLPISWLSSFQAAVVQTILLGLIVGPAVYYFLLIPLRQKTIHEEKIMHSLYDTLTGLPNRALFNALLEQAIKTADREVYPLAVAIIDPSGMSDVNQALGYDYGDKVIKQCADQLAATMRESDMLARIDANAFAVALPRVGIPELGKTIGKLRTVFDLPFQINGASINVGSHIGVTLYPDHGDNVELLLQHADIALNRCKTERAGFLVYDTQDALKTKRRVKIYGDLKSALNHNNGFELYYQPQVALETGRLFGVEALIRWTDNNAVSPGEFIPIAEQTGLITEITRWAIEEGIRQCSQWLEEGRRIPVSINMSARCLHDESIKNFLFDQCEQYKLPCSMITIEITESSIMAHPEEALAVIQGIREKGFLVSIDDFGTGHSSLAYLKNIPATELKIDQIFVADILTDKRDAIVVQLMIDLASKFGLSVVVEGVETREILEMLRAFGAENIQGYYFSRPLPARDLIEWDEARDPLA